MHEELKTKLESTAANAGIKIDCDISILEKKSWRIFADLKKHLLTENLTITSFKKLNTIWKANIVLARFIFKYSLFAENYILALLENMLMLDKPEFAKRIDNAISKIESEGANIKPKQIEKLSTFKNIKSKNYEGRSLFDIKFSEKITVYKEAKGAFASKLNLPNKIKFDKIRTLRNKAVHSEYILNFFLNNSGKDNILDLFNVIDDAYKQQFIDEFMEIVKKYGLEIFFDWFDFQILLNT